MNWTVRFGTIWNYWSWMGIRPPLSTTPLRVTIAAESAVVAGASTPVTVRVFEDAVALPDSMVWLEASAGVVSPDSGRTDSSGRFVASFSAPNVDAVTTVILSATASHPDFRDPGTAQAAVWVFPPGERFLSLTLELPLGDRVRGDSNLPMAIQVRDDMGSVVGDATVTISTSRPELLVAAPANGTASELSQVVLRASSSNTRESVEVAVTAQKPGHSNARSYTAIIVLPGSAPPPPPPPVPLPNYDGPIAAIGLLVATGGAVTGSLLFLRWARGRRIDREP